VFDCISQLFYFIFVKATELTISSSVWPMFHPSSRHLRYGTTLSVVSTRELLQKRLQSPSSVPAAWRCTDTSSCTSPCMTRPTSVSWRSTFTVSCKLCSYLPANWQTFHSKVQIEYKFLVRKYRVPKWSLFISSWVQLCSGKAVVITTLNERNTNIIGTKFLI